MTKLFHLLFCVFLTSQFAFLTAQAGDEKVKPSPETYTDATGSLAFAGYDRAPAHPVVGQNGMVAAQERIAAQVGRDILAKGGNAVDAAVAMGFALAVTHPSAGNLGGGGFMMIALPDTNKVIALDFREMAPRGASRDMYLDAHGNVDKSKAQFSRLSAGIPGTVAGLLEALETYGTMNRKQVMAPAIRLADKGFPVSYGLSHSLKSVKKYLAKDPSSIKYFYKPDGSPYAQGEMFRQKDLAKTLKRIARYGAKEFYEGKTARLLADEMKRGGGLITLEDMKAYHTVTRTPVHGTYRGYEIYSMPPPSSGGVHVIQMLNILEGYDLGAMEHNSAAYLHLLIETMRRAYADRSKYLGDPDFFDVPVAALTSKGYAADLRKSINPDHASKSTDIAPGRYFPHESFQTTHYSVVDKNGGAVAVTYTLNFSYGAGYSVDGAGFLLNNEMDDFSAKPGAPNGYGLIGGEANAIAPFKRPLSSMTPTIVKKNGEVFFVTGSPGGSTIITVTLQTILNVIDFKMNAMQAVTSPRIHHQWLPDIIISEPDISADTLRELERRGFHIPKGKDGKYKHTTLGRANAVLRKGGFVFGAADPRAPEAGAFGD